MPGFFLGIWLLKKVGKLRVKNMKPINDFFKRIKLFWKISLEATRFDARKFNFMSVEQWAFCSLWENNFNTKSDTELIQLYKNCMHSDNPIKYIHREIGIKNPSPAMITWFLDYLKTALINRFIEKHKFISNFNLGHICADNVKDEYSIDSIKHGYVSGNGRIYDIFCIACELAKVTGNAVYHNDDDCPKIYELRLKLFFRLKSIQTKANDLKDSGKETDKFWRDLMEKYDDK
jgi:hypothetical protein